MPHFPRPRQSGGRRIPSYVAANQAAARILLESPSTWGGEESLPVRWARLVLELPPPAPPIPKGQLSHGLEASAS